MPLFWGHSVEAIEEFADVKPGREEATEDTARWGKKMGVQE